MWYVVHLLFAPAVSEAGKPVLCETSQVLIEAANAFAACDRGEAWGREHQKESTMRLVGVEHVHVLDQAPGDGVEVGGMFIDIDDPWGRRNELIPPRDQLSAVKWERDVPISDFATPEQMARLHRIFDA
jgi:hypothetical protein